MIDAEADEQAALAFSEALSSAALGSMAVKSSGFRNRPLLNEARKSLASADFAGAKRAFQATGGLHAAISSLSPKIQGSAWSEIFLSSNRWARIGSLCGAFDSPQDSLQIALCFCQHFAHGHPALELATHLEYWQSFAPIDLRPDASRRADLFEQSCSALLDELASRGRQAQWWAAHDLLDQVGAKASPYFAYAPTLAGLHVLPKKADESSWENLKQAQSAYLERRQIAMGLAQHGANGKQCRSSL